MSEELDSYDGWRRRGFQVQRGAKAVKYDTARESHMFGASQVEAILDDESDDPDDAMEMWARGEWP